MGCINVVGWRARIRRPGGLQAVRCKQRHVPRVLVALEPGSQRVLCAVVSRAVQEGSDGGGWHCGPLPLTYRPCHVACSGPRVCLECDPSKPDVCRNCTFDYDGVSDS